MKIIDFKRKGNVVRFLLGSDDLNEWYGDDWDDVPYEYNAETVYDRYVSGYIDVCFPMDSLVLEPEDGNWKGSRFSKNDMRERKTPCIIIVPEELASKDDYKLAFDDWVGADGQVIKIYFGDSDNLLLEKINDHGFVLKLCENITDKI